jgi:hypothetical protein
LAPTHVANISQYDMCRFAIGMAGIRPKPFLVAIIVFPPIN